MLHCATMQVSRKTLYLLSLLTLVGFPLLAWLVLWFSNNISFIDIFIHGTTLTEQLWRGLIYGMIAAANAVWLVRLDFLKPVTGVFKELLGHINLNWIDVLFFSFCAGVGEEIFFRGALQYHFGVWLTAFIFILIHGYLSITDWRITLYGILMVIIVAGMGYLMNNYGIWAAAMAHFVFDVVMFGYLIKYDAFD